MYEVVWYRDGIKQIEIHDNETDAEFRVRMLQVYGDCEVNYSVYYRRI